MALEYYQRHNECSRYRIYKSAHINLHAVGESKIINRRGFQLVARCLKTLINLQNTCGELNMINLYISQIACSLRKCLSDKHWNLYCAYCCITFSILDK